MNDETKLATRTEPKSSTTIATGHVAEKVQDSDLDQVAGGTAIVIKPIIREIDEASP